MEHIELDARVKHVRAGLIYILDMNARDLGPGMDQTKKGNSDKI